MSTKQEREQKKAEALDLVDLRISIYNAKIETLEPYVKAYWRALAELWQHPKSAERDNAILAKYGLGSIERTTMNYSQHFGTYQPCHSFSWNYDLWALNKAIRA